MWLRRCIGAIVSATTALGVGLAVTAFTLPSTAKHVVLAQRSGDVVLVQPEVSVGVSPRFAWVGTIETLDWKPVCLDIHRHINLGWADRLDFYTEPAENDLVLLQFMQVCSDYHHWGPIGFARVNNMTEFVVWLPTWLIIGLMMLPITLLTLCHLVHRRPPGHCRRCGYDLRATPERCPECGMVVQSKRVAKSP